MGVGESVSVGTKFWGDRACIVTWGKEAEAESVGAWAAGGELGCARGNVVLIWLQPVAIVESNASDNQQAGARGMN